MRHLGQMSVIFEGPGLFGPGTESRWLKDCSEHRPMSLHWDGVHA